MASVVFTSASPPDALVSASATVSAAGSVGAFSAGAEDAAAAVGSNMSFNLHHTQNAMGCREVGHAREKWRERERCEDKQS